MQKVSTYIHNSVNFKNTDLVKHCEDQDIEISALKLEFNLVNLCVLTIYRALTGKFNNFLHRLDSILQILYIPILHIIICGDININYFIESEMKK